MKPPLDFLEEREKLSELVAQVTNPTLRDALEEQVARLTLGHYQRVETAGEEMWNKALERAGLR